MQALHFRASSSKSAESQAASTLAWKGVQLKEPTRSSLVRLSRSGPVTAHWQQGAGTGRLACARGCGACHRQQIGELAQLVGHSAKGQPAWR